MEPTTILGCRYSLIISKFIPQENEKHIGDAILESELKYRVTVEYYVTDGAPRKNIYVPFGRSTYVPIFTTLPSFHLQFTHCGTNEEGEELYSAFEYSLEEGGNGGRVWG